jgi:hypothetical protein
LKRVKREREGEREKGVRKGKERGDKDRVEGREGKEGERG